MGCQKPPAGKVCRRYPQPIMNVAESVASKGQNRSPVRLLNVKSAGRYLSLSLWTVRGMVFRGEVPFVRAGRRILIDVRDLDQWIEDHKEQF